MCALTNSELKINDDANDYVGASDDASDANNERNDYVGAKDDAR
jgi:hypothetical protein